MKKLVIIGLLLTGIILSWLFFRKSATNSPRCSQSTMQKFYKNCLYKEEQRLWHELEQKYGITYVECKKVASQLTESEREKNPLPLSPAMKDLIIHVLDDFCLPGVTAIGFSDSISPAETDQKKLYINENLFEKHTQRGKKYIIGHELRHQVNNDAPIITALECLLKQKRIDIDTPHNPLHRMSRFFEMRADIETAIKSKEYAQGFLDAIDQFRQEQNGNDSKGITHPKFSIRHKTGEILLAAHHKVNKVA